MMLSVFSFIINIYLLQTKNIVLPFKKLTIEYLKEIKSISDFISFNIYTNISMGTPKQNVAHFITNDKNKLFYYDIFQLYQHQNEEFNATQKEIENSLNSYFSSIISSTFQVIDDKGICSDYFYLYDSNQKETKCYLNFYMSQEKVNLNTYGTINFNYLKYDDNSNIFFLYLLKSKAIIDGWYFTFIYGDYDMDNNYLNDDYSNILGNLILGESPTEFAPDKYNKEDEIKVKANIRLNKIFQISIDEIILFNHSETNIQLNINFHSNFIKVSYKYEDIIYDLFFKELIIKRICKRETIYDNIYKEKNYVYSCDNCDEMKEKLKSFPTLYLKIKTIGLTFLFSYKELFKLHNGRLYFLIIYDYHLRIDWDWDVGDLFLRKYITSFNCDTKTFSFYKSQVEDINKKTDYPDKIPEEEYEENKEEKIENEEESKKKEEQKEDIEKENKEEENEGNEKKSKENEEESKENEEEFKREESKENEEKSKENENKEKEEETKEKGNYEEKETNKKKSGINTNGGDSNKSDKVLIIVGIVGGTLLAVAIVVIIILVLKLKSLRKSKVDELIKDDREFPLSNNPY